MSLTIRQLLINHSRGINTALHTYPEEYFEDEIIPQFDDIVDLQNFRDELKQRDKDLSEAIREENSRKTTTPTSGSENVQQNADKHVNTVRTDMGPEKNGPNLPGVPGGPQQTP